MKNLKVSMSILIVFFTSLVGAQEVVDIQNTTLKKTFAVEQGGSIIPHTVTVYKTSKKILSLKDEDLNKLNQSAERSDTYVTKLIYIDNQVFDEYDKYITMRYIKDKNDTFEVEPTPTGFKVIVDKKYVEYVYDKGLYMVDSPDKDYFVVEEFSTI